MNLPFICGVAGLGLALAGCGKPVESSAVVVDEGRQLVMDSIAAHGGTEKWYGSGQLQFRWTYHMSDKGPEAVVDTLRECKLFCVSWLFSDVG